MDPVNCRICNALTEPFSRARILSRHEVAYHACPACGFVCTDDPHWLDEAYSEAINRTDVGLIARNQMLSRVVLAVAGTLFDRTGRFVDYGGGYGMLVRMMRDQGLDFYRSDRYAPNLFAADFEAPEPDGQPYELLTAFEVFEHLVDPVAELERMLRYSPNIFFSTVLLPPDRPKPTEWWYYGLDHGQHVSFFTRQALMKLAERFDLHLLSRGSFHLLSKERRSARRFALATDRRASRLFVPLFRRPSLQPADYERAIAGVRP